MKKIFRALTLCLVLLSLLCAAVPAAFAAEGDTLPAGATN